MRPGRKVAVTCRLCGKRLDVIIPRGSRMMAIARRKGRMDGSMLTVKALTLTQPWASLVALGLWNWKENM